MAKTVVSAAPTRRASRPASTTGGENVRRNAAGRGRSSAALIGHARVSTADQSIDRQIDALEAAGCVRIFFEHGVSGTVAARPGLDKALDWARAGDTICVQSLDRLGRRTVELLRLVEDLRERGVGLRILNLGVDTGTPAGQMVLTIMAALAQMEREVLAERTRNGLAAAAARGRRGGRPPSLTDEQVEAAREWRAAGRSVREIARLLGTSERTIRRRLDPME